ncbi:hypothetical protein LTR09_001778 [Extremus antarcticus]|uniref:Uncharacterized protein n=1 Tax=Extremus antarcticus TaxID=702011 RepID=A0AAJ0GHC5_9PEZI|nr:hypothetical protein LTR09_001778 [Extremus antarcticus]
MSEGPSIFGGGKEPPPPSPDGISAKANANESDEQKQQRTIKAERQQALASYQKTAKYAREGINIVYKEEDQRVASNELAHISSIVVSLKEQVLGSAKDEDLVGSEELESIEANMEALMSEAIECDVHLMSKDTRERAK